MHRVLDAVHPGATGLHAIQFVLCSFSFSIVRSQQVVALKSRKTKVVYFKGVRNRVFRCEIISIKYPSFSFETFSDLLLVFVTNFIRGRNDTVSNMIATIVGLSGSLGPQ